MSKEPPEPTALISAEQKALATRIIEMAEDLGGTTLEDRRRRELPDPDPEEWGHRWLNYVLATELLHIAMMIPGTNLHTAPDTLAHMLPHPTTDQPATVPEMVRLWRMTEPLATYRLPWIPDVTGHSAPGGVALDLPELAQLQESIMGWVGAIPAEDSVEIAKNGDRKNGVWLAAPPLEKWQEEGLVHVTTGRGKTKEKKLIHHPAGVFCLIPTGVERKKTAAFFTPEVLATFTAQQAIETLIDEGTITQADDWLSLSINEPSVGSGAILSHTIRLVAEKYLDMKQEELGRTIPADEFVIELQKAKQFFAHRVTGVDLNPGSVKIAEIALWIDTIIPTHTKENAA